MSSLNQDPGNMVSLVDRWIHSSSFNPLYRDGMELVEEAAIYLDDEGRRAAKSLNRPVASLYAAESMRLTTRLMQAAAWLLLQSALRNGEMNHAQALAEKTKIRLETFSARDIDENWSKLPARFQDLIDRSLELERTIIRSDQQIFGQAKRKSPPRNQVVEQQNLLRTAFE